MSTPEVRTLFTILEDIATALDPLSDEIPGMQIVTLWNTNPTPPSIDIYPADPFTEPGSFGIEGDQLFFIVRARVHTADQDAGQTLLVRMLDPTDPACVAAALAEMYPPVVPVEIAGFREYLDTGHLGTEWRVSTFL